MNTHPCKFSLSLGRSALLAAALAVGASVSGVGHAQESPHKATPPERMMPEPAKDGGGSQGSGSEKNVQSDEKSPADRMAPASKVEKPMPNNGEATNEDVKKKEAEQRDGNSGASPETGKAQVR